MLTILHTADWHLGHSLHGVSREYEHLCFLNWLVVQLQECNADALIIAGDIFDSANPSANAQSIFYDFLLQAKEKNPSLDIVIIGGNHDSAARLDAPSQILQSLGIKVIGGLTRIDETELDNVPDIHQVQWQRLIVPLTDQTGTVKAICGAMPFIRNADLPEIPNSTEANDPLISGVAELYRQLYEHMQHYKAEQDLDNSVAQILTGHCYMVGTELSELSERRILGGNQHALPATIFNADINYVALGHLHKSQRVKNSDNINIYYSGSPLPLSFSEKNYQHKIYKIMLEANARSDKISTQGSEPQLITTDIEAIIIPRAVAMRVIPERGYVSLSELEALIEEQDFELLNTREQEEHKYPLLEVRLQLDKPEPGLRQQVETLLAEKAVRLLKITTHYPGKGDALAEQQPHTRLEELHPEDVFQQCYERNFEQSAPKHILTLFRQLLESVEEND